MSRKRIMVVDDEADLLRVVTTRLQKSGYEVIPINDSRLVFDKAKAEKPDLIVLDIMMPNINGMEVAHMLRQYSATRDIPVIYLTALMKKNEIDVAGRGSSNPVLAKPFDSAELIREIEQTFRL